MATDTTVAVGNSDHDFSDYDLVVDGVTISQCTGLSDFKEEFKTTPNQGPGMRRFGMNTTSGANGCSFKLHLRQTSLDRKVVEDKARAQRGVAITWRLARNYDKYPVGFLFEEGCLQGWIQPGAESFGEEAQDITFDVEGIGPVKRYIASAATSATTAPATTNGAGLA